MKWRESDLAGRFACCFWLLGGVFQFVLIFWIDQGNNWTTVNTFALAVSGYWARKVLIMGAQRRELAKLDKYDQLRKNARWN